MPNKTDAGNGSYGIGRVSNVLRSPSPDPKRSAKKQSLSLLPESGSVVIFEQKTYFVECLAFACPALRLAGRSARAPFTLRSC